MSSGTAGDLLRIENEVGIWHLGLCILNLLVRVSGLWPLHPLRFVMVVVIG